MMTTPPSARAIVYTRVSTVEQTHGYSLQTQAESCRRYCTERGYTVLAEFSDAHSGTELDRPGLNAALDAVKTARPDVVVLHDVDRLGREIIVQAIAERELTRHGARVEYVLGGNSGDPSGELLKTIKGAIAVYENRQRVERSKRGKDGRIRAGHPLVAARPAYGYLYIAGDRTGELQPHPEEATIVRRIYAWIATRTIDYEVAKRLCAEGVPTRADYDPTVHKVTDRHFWDPHTVARIVRNETNKGVWYWNKTKKVARDDGQEGKIQRKRPREEWLTIAVTPLVDEATWQRAQDKLADSKRYALAKTNARRDYLLRGLVFCPCGRRWTGRYKNTRDRAYYGCPTTEGEPWRVDCATRFGIEQYRLESSVLGAVKSFLLDDDVRRTALGAEQDRVAAERAQLNEDLATIDASLTKVERQLGKLLDDALTDDFPADLISRRKRDLVAERERLAGDKERRLAALQTPVVDVEAAVAELVPTVETAFAAASRAELRQLLDLLRVEVRVQDRNTVMLSGVIGTVVELHQREPGRKRERPRRPAQGHLPVLQRLPQHLQGAGGKLRQLVEEQHTPVRQTHFTRTRPRTAADQPGAARPMMRRPKRPLPQQGCVGWQQPAHTVDLRGLVSLIRSSSKKSGLAARVSVRSGYPSRSPSPSLTATMTATHLETSRDPDNGLSRHGGFCVEDGSAELVVVHRGRPVEVLAYDAQFHGRYRPMFGKVLVSVVLCQGGKRRPSGAAQPDRVDASERRKHRSCRNHQRGKLRKERDKEPAACGRPMPLTAVFVHLLSSS